MFEKTKSEARARNLRMFIQHIFCDKVRQNQKVNGVPRSNSQKVSFFSKTPIFSPTQAINASTIIFTIIAICIFICSSLNPLSLLFTLIYVKLYIFSNKFRAVIKVDGIPCSVDFLNRFFQTYSQLFVFHKQVVLLFTNQKYLFMQTILVTA